MHPDESRCNSKVPNFLFRERSREKSIAYFNQKVTEDEEVRSKLYRFHLGTEDLIYNGPFKDHTNDQKSI